MGYAAIVLTTTPLSITCARSPARCAETAAARPHGPPPTITRSASFAIEFIRWSDDADRARGQRALHADDLITSCAHAHIRDLRLDERLNAVEVAASLRRQISKASSFRRSGLPAVEPLVTGHGATEHIQVAGKFLVDLAVRFVSCAETDPVQSVEHIELRDGEISEPVDPSGIANDDAVEPAAAARPTGGRTKLISEPPNLRLQRLFELRRQRPVSNARGVRLHHTDYRIEFTGRDSYSSCGSARRRAAGRDVGIGPVIDVKEGPLRTLEEHRGTAHDRAMNLETDILSQGKEPLREPIQDSKGVIDVCSLRPSHRELDVGVRNSTLDQFSQPLGIPQIEDADSAAAKFVLVRRADSPSCSSDLLAGRALAVDQLVIGQHEMRAVAYVEPSLDVDTIGNELVDLREKGLDIQYDSVADRAPHARMENSARDLMEDERLVPDLDGVTGVGAALIANYPVGALRENINELALALVSPLGTDDDDCACV